MNRRAAAPPPPAWLPVAAAALGFALPIVLMLRAASGPFAFPVDDAWIHLTYARNLADHGAFSYFPGDRTTTGSTAPLFTLLEAVAFRLTRNEYVIGLGLGVLAHAAFLWALARWALARLGHAGWAALAVALVALDGRFAMLAASGMETSLFLAGIALAFLGWSRRDARLAGIALGLATWVRPEAILLAGVFAIDAALARRAPRRWIAGIGIFAALVAAYALFNRITGGAWFPDTLAAKSAFYGSRGLARFLREDVAAMLSGAWSLVAALALVDGAAKLRRAFARDPDASLAEIGWAVALPLAYAVTLPFSHRFNRYLVPALPALAIAGAAGMRWTIAKLASRRGTVAKRAKAPPPPAAPAARTGAGGIAAVSALMLLAVQAWSFSYALAEYGAICRYHAERHVRAGKWLRDRTPPGAVIAAHDVGAIAFYSRRRIVDMVGLVSPEVIPHLEKPDYLPFLTRLFEQRHVTHLAVLEEWQPVDNQRPVFEPTPEPEVLHVYEWKPGVTHLVPAAAGAKIGEAREALGAGRLDVAEAAIREALAIDPLASSAWVGLGAIALRSGRPDEARRAFEHALQLFPESEDARRGLEAARR